MTFQEILLFQKHQQEIKAAEAARLQEKHRARLLDSSLTQKEIDRLCAELAEARNFIEKIAIGTWNDSNTIAHRASLFLNPLMS